MKHRVDSLEGTLLDVAVAKADGLLVTAADEIAAGKVAMGRAPDFPHGYIVYRFNSETGKPNGYDWLRQSPSTDWALGGPIIQRERITVSAHGSGAAWHADHFDTTRRAYGPTPLIAGMRAYVASKFGDEVELP